MPRQGQSVETCILTAFYKKTGEQVEKGDLLFAYETDKASFEEEAPEDGTFLGAFYEEGDEVPVLETVCVIGTPGEDISSFGSSPKSEKASTSKALETEPSAPPLQKEAAPATPSGYSDTIKISPRARKRAEVEQVPVDELQGTGPNGRILDRDVVAWLQSQPRAAKAEAPKVAPQEAKPQSPPQPAAQAEAGDYEILPLTNIRKIIARAMHNSLQSSAQLTHHLTADARQLLANRQKSKEQVAAGTGINLTLNDFISFAVVKALKLFPQVNAHLSNEQLKIFKGIHLGMAVDTDRGLMVPVVKNAGDYNIEGLSKRMKELAETSRKGNIDPSLIAPEAASFTISNLGNYGVEMFTPVINLPQVAILGVNTIIYRPQPMKDGSMAIIPRIGLSLTYDHRALDGGQATRFLKEVADQIEGGLPLALPQ